MDSFYSVKSVLNWGEDYHHSEACSNKRIIIFFQEKLIMDVKTIDYILY